MNIAEIWSIREKGLLIEMGPVILVLGLRSTV